MEYKAIESFNPHFDALARVAYFGIAIKPVSGRKLKLHYALRVVVWFFVILYNLQHIINVIVHRHNTDRIVDTLFILLTTLSTLGNQVAFNLRSGRIQRLLRVVDGDLFAPTHPNHVSDMKQNALAMNRLLNMFIGAIFTCGTLWTIFPLVNRAMGEEVRMSAYFPYEITSSPIFEITVAYMSILITWQAYGNVTMDCTIVAFYAQAKLQLKMLRDNMEQILCGQDKFGEKSKYGRSIGFVKTSTGFVDIDDLAFGEVLQKRLANHVEHYRMIVWFLDEIESIFAEALFFKFLISAWVLCMTVYKIVGLNLLSAEFVSMAMYLVCILVEMFIYCYHGSQVKVESDFVNSSIYCCAWTTVSPRFRRQLLLMMTSCNRPLAPRISYIIPISLDTCITVIKSSYTLFTFLNSRR